MYELHDDHARRVITVKLTGFIDVTEMKKICTEYKVITDGYGNEPHFILADMRGLKPCAPDAAAELGELIKYGRTHGVSGCAHLSDSSIAKLQAARLARQATPNDDITIDVVSMEEAHNVLSERRAELVLKGKLKSA